MRRRRNTQDEEIRQLLRELSTQPNLHVARRLVRAYERQAAGREVLDHPISISRLREAVNDGERVVGLIKVSLSEAVNRNFSNIVAERLAGGPLREMSWRIVDVAGDNEIILEASGDATRLVDRVGEIVSRVAVRNRLWATSCGLNADWSVSAWHLVLPGDNTRPNTRSGDLYLLESEDGPPDWVLVQRFYEADESGDDRIDEIESSDNLDEILRHAGARLRGEWMRS